MWEGKDGCEAQTLARSRGFACSFLAVRVCRPPAAYAEVICPTPPPPSPCRVHGHDHCFFITTSVQVSHLDHLL